MDLAQQASALSSHISGRNASRHTRLTAPSAVCTLHRESGGIQPFPSGPTNVEKLPGSDDHLSGGRSGNTAASDLLASRQVIQARENSPREEEGRA